MKTIAAKGLGPTLHLTVVERSKPSPSDHDVLVKVYSASVNPKDWKLNRSYAHLVTPLGNKILPPIFGDDLAGEVVAIGKKVNNFAIGDRVFGMDMRLRTASLAEYAVINTRRLAHLPNVIEYHDAAGVPLAGQTALQGLRQGGATTGSSVLIIGASGGVGTYAVQIAKIMGCHVTGVCSARNTELVEELGADDTLDYTAGDYRSSAGPFDLVFDVTSYETPGSCRKLVKPGGHFISTMGHARGTVATFFANRKKASIVVVESYTEDLNTLADWMKTGKLRTVIDSQFPLEDAEQAYARSRTGRARGKVIITVAT